ncbi:MAG: S49 family peptidase [Candidatus Buchananbacteria bacterium]|nr:S49 family peptidase [Candidatus Buchananbacteria bacterium]
MKFKLFDSVRDKKILKGLMIAIFLIASLMVIYDSVMSSNYSDTANTEIGSTEGNCNVVGINLHGEVVTYVPPENEGSNGYSTQDQTGSESIMQYIEEAEADDSIKAIVMEIDSMGGSPVAGEEISLALKNAKKPSVVFIRSAGDSSAYLAATGADKIYASKYSDVGSIGVTMSYLDSSRENQLSGQTYNSLSSGKFKDSGDPDKSLSNEEKAIFMRDIIIMKNNFVKNVAENRKLDIKKVEFLADGSTMLGEMALQNGLIDAIGGYPEIKDYLTKTIGEKPEICWY